MAPFCLSLHSSISMAFTAFHSKYLKRPTVITKDHASGFKSYNPFTTDNVAQNVVYWIRCFYYDFPEAQWVLWICTVWKSA